MLVRKGVMSLCNKQYHNYIITNHNVPTDHTQTGHHRNTSNLTHFTTELCSLHIDVSAAKGLATALTHSKTLESVVVKEYPTTNNDVVRVLLEAMNYSRVEWRNW